MKIKHWNKKIKINREIRKKIKKLNRQIKIKNKALKTLNRVKMKHNKMQLSKRKALLFKIIIKSDLLNHNKM